MYALEIEHLTKRYGHDVVVEDLSFTVHPGRVTGFLGPNGAGKSTTMKVLLDLASADRGRAAIGGKRYRDLRDPARKVGVALEPNAFHPGRTGRNQVRILADGAGIDTARVEEMLQLVGLTDAADRRVGAYSLGMRQRLGLAAALLGDPPVLVLDEPGNGLDPKGIRELRDLLRVRAANGSTVFVSSHLLAEVEHLADEVVVINRGRLVVAGALSDLQKAGTSVRTLSTEPLTEILEAAGGTVQVRADGDLLVRGLPIAEIGDRACAAGIALHELAPLSGSLEELFMGWTGGDEIHETTARGQTEKEVEPL
jgi:ABC-2 type transport system ATP-binding protein